MGVWPCFCLLLRIVCMCQELFLTFCCVYYWLFFFACSDFCNLSSWDALLLAKIAVTLVTVRRNSKHLTTKVHLQSNADVTVVVTVVIENYGYQTYGGPHSSNREFNWDAFFLSQCYHLLCDVIERSHEQKYFSLADNRGFSLVPSGLDVFDWKECSFSLRNSEIRVSAPLAYLP